MPAKMLIAQFQKPLKNSGASVVAVRHMIAILRLDALARLGP